MREAIIIGLVLGFFFFAGSAALTALATKHATPTFLWDVVLWGGITGMVLSVCALAYYVTAQIFDLPFLGPATIGSLGVCALVAAGIWATAQKQNRPKEVLPVLAVECSLSRLPSTVPPDGFVFIDFFYDPSWPGDGGPIGFGGTSLQPGEQLQGYTDRTLGQTMRCVITNQGTFTLFSINFALKVQFRESVARPDGNAISSGAVVKERDWPLGITKIDAGKTFTFYALTQGRYFVSASFPQSATYFDPDTNERKDARLLLLSWDSLSLTPATINKEK